MNREANPDSPDQVQWEIVDDDLLLLDQAQATVYRFSGGETTQLRAAAQRLLADTHNPAGSADGPDLGELADVARLGDDGPSGLLSRRAVLKTAAAAGIVIGVTGLRLPSAAAQGSGDPAPQALAAVTDATTAEVIGSP